MIAALGLEALTSRWRERAERMRGDVDERGAVLAEKYARELEDYVRERCERLVGLREAGRLVGRSADTIGRMIREGKLWNYGCRHAPRVRIGDLLGMSGGASSPLRDSGENSSLREGDHDATMSARRIVSSVITSRTRSV